jgi:excisionase family DNA binding protein
LQIEQRLYTVQEVARLTRLTPGWIYELGQRGRIRVVRFGRRAVRIPSDEVARLLHVGLLDGEGQAAG